MATLAAESPVQKLTAELNGLHHQFEEWLSHPDDGKQRWRVSYGVVRPNLYNRPGIEDVYGLILESPDGETKALIERLKPDREGRPRVELMGWPSLVRVHLRGNGNDSWEIETESGIPFHRPWTRESFLTLLGDLEQLNREFD